MRTLYLIDASGYLFRAYFAIGKMSNSKGMATGALFGFARSLLKLSKDFQPQHIAAVFDAPQARKTRQAIYSAYKAHRTIIPDDLPTQIEAAKTFCTLSGIPQLEIAGAEADDVLAATALWGKENGFTVYICSSDKDLCQLVDEKIFMLNTHKENQILDKNGVKEQYGVWPHQIVDYLSIVGDSSDNIPGLSGFGPKTAAALLEEFETLDNILEHPEKVSGAKKQETIRAEKEKALLSRKLVALHTEQPIPKNPEFYQKKQLDTQPLKAFYLEMGFASLLKELESSTSNATTATTTSPTSQLLTEERLSYHLVDDESSLENLIRTLAQAKEICVDTETTSLRPQEAELVGIGFCIKASEAYYVPVNGNVGQEKVLQALKPILENPSLSYFGHNIKYDLHILANHGIRIPNIGFDTILASYLLSAESHRHSLDALALHYFGKQKIPIESLIGKGKKEISMREVTIDKVCAYCCEDVDYTCRLKQLLEPQLIERGLMHLLKEIELPVMRILEKMERAGIYLKVDHLTSMSERISVRIAALAEEIYQLAGEPFTINSPKQLGHILFEKLGITPPKRTQTGFSTDAEVLELLAENYPIAGKVLHYRQLEKLRSTYIDALPAEVNPKTGRIHCTYTQFVAATGRLASQNPNLQNIPIRTEEGKIIREGFAPQQPGWSFLSADYSQIELRLLAHLSEEPNLIHAFEQGEDVHAFTASLVFGIPLAEVSDSQRNMAKSVNFGIIYGQQAFGLSKQLGIPRANAQLFIDTYFQRYPKVAELIERYKEEARKTGKARTLTGRERAIPDIRAKNPMLKTAAERLAVNSPLQGTAADLIKLAMIDIDQKLRNAHLKAYPVLQIHDELLFELPDEEIPALSALVKKSMEGVMQLKVPLVVNIAIGKNWKEC